MSAGWIEALNALAAGWCEAMLRASWQGGVALALVWVVKRLWKRMPPALGCWLWRLAYVKLLVSLLWVTPVDLPILPTSTVATGSLSAGEVSERGEEAGSRLLALSVEAGQGAGIVSKDGAAPAPLTGASWLLLAWIAGVMGLGWRARRERQEIRRLLRGGRAVSAARVSDCLHALCGRLGVRRPPKLLAVESEQGPLVVGLGRATIVIPDSLLARWEDRELALVLAHELAHLRRRDLGWNRLPAAAQALFFFHPLVWLAGREWRLAQEMACDELALRTTRAPVERYGQVLLDVAAQHIGPERKPLAAVGVADGYWSLQRRLSQMSSMTLVSRPWWVAAGILLGIAAAVTVVPWRTVPQGSPIRYPGSGLVRRVQSLYQALRPVPAWPPLVVFDYTLSDLRGQDLALLTDPQVMTDLKLTQQQQAGVEGIMETLRRDLWRLWSRVERRPEARAGLKEPLRQMRQSSHAQVYAVLTGAQEKRLRQIGLQHMGLRNTLQREDVASSLRLTPQQRAQIRALLAEKRQTSAPPLQVVEKGGKGPERLSAHEGLMELQERIDARAAAVLTDAQWAQLEQMVGPPFRSWPVRQISRASAEKAPAELKAESERRLKKLGLALRMYAQDWSMVLPPMEDAQAAKKALSPYLRTVLPPTTDAQAAKGRLSPIIRRDETVFLDPHTNAPYRPSVAVSRHQIYGPVRIQGPGPQQGQIWRVYAGDHSERMKVKGYIPVSQEKGKVAFYEPEAGPDGSRAVLFLDGRVARVTAAEWRRPMPVAETR